MLELRIIPDVELVLRKVGSPPIHAVRALSINNRCEVLDYLQNLKKSHLPEYKKLIQNITQLAQNQRVNDENKVKRGKGTNSVWEVRVRKGHSRLFFAYVPTSRGLEVVLFTHGYFKSDDSKAKQNQEFQRSSDQIQTYMKEIIELLETEFSK